MKPQEFPAAPDLDKWVHDIRNELNAIAMNAELARMLLEQQGAADAAMKALNVILEKSAACGRILEDMRRPG